MGLRAFDVERDADFVCDFEQRPIRRPELNPGDNRRSQQVRVYPANPAAMKLARPDERDDIVVRHGRYLHDLFVVGQDLLAASAISACVTSRW